MSCLRGSRVSHFSASQQIDELKTETSRVSRIELFRTPMLVP